MLWIAKAMIYKLKKECCHLTIWEIWEIHMILGYQNIRMNCQEKGFIFYEGFEMLNQLPQNIKENNALLKFKSECKKSDI